MSVDLVWIVGGRPDAPGREELRYSIRSAVENFKFDYRDVVIVGDVPDWFTGVKMPLEPDADKWTNQRNSISAYVNHPYAADEFVLMNDDFFVLEPVAEIEPIRNTKGTASEFADGHVKHGRGCWACAVITCSSWVADETGDDPYIFEAHTPLMFDTARLRDLVNRYPADIPFMAGCTVAIAGVGYPGRTVGNAKVKGHDLPHLDHKLSLPMPYISGNPDSWKAGLGKHIRDMYLGACEWEK